MAWGRETFESSPTLVQVALVWFVFLPESTIVPSFKFPNLFQLRFSLKSKHVDTIS